MKTLIILAVIISSVATTQVKAAAIAGSYLATTLVYGSLAFSERGAHKQVIEDSQDYLQTGDMSLALAQTVRDVQAIHPDMSESEVVDAIMNEAETMLGM